MWRTIAVRGPLLVPADGQIFHDTTGQCADLILPASGRSCPPFYAGVMTADGQITTLRALAA